MKQKYLAEIQSKVDAVPYGDVHLVISRHGNKTVKADFTSTETLRYTDNTTALEDIINFLDGLIAANHTGAVQFEIVIQEGQLRLLAIKNTTETKY